MNYVLFITAVGVGCKNCESNYQEFRKLASYLAADEFKGFQLGVLDLTKDQVPIKNLTKIPSLYLFEAQGGIDHPIYYEGKLEFMGMLNYLNHHSKLRDPNDSKASLNSIEE